MILNTLYIGKIICILHHRIFNIYILFLLCVVRRYHIILYRWYRKTHKLLVLRGYIYMMELWKNHVPISNVAHIIYFIILSSMQKYVHVCDRETLYSSNNMMMNVSIVNVWRIFCSWPHGGKTHTAQPCCQTYII